jgi:hypothetical protein
MPTAPIARSSANQAAASGCKPGKCSSDRVFRQRPVAPLVRLDVLDRHQVIPIHRARFGHVDDHAGPDQLLQRNLVDRAPLVVKMDRSVDMRPAVLRRSETVGGVVVAPFSDSLEPGLQRETGFGGPVDRLIVESVGQIDHLSTRQIRRPGATGQKSQQGSRCPPRELPGDRASHLGLLSCRF